MSYRDADEAASHRIEELERRLEALDGEADELEARIADAAPPSWSWRWLAAMVVTLTLVLTMATLR